MGAIHRSRSAGSPNDRSPIQQTIDLGVDFWNDSCDLAQLAEAVREGAVGATSNPVIVYEAVKSNPQVWEPVLDTLIAKQGQSSEDEIAWMLIESITKKAAALLLPVYEKTQGHKGFLSAQVNPKLFRNTEKMVEHARTLSRLAPNIAIKVPATEAGVRTMEQLTSEGIRINATVCFSVPQAIACAEAVERGLATARANGMETRTLLPTVTIMVGRIDDHLKRVLSTNGITIDPGYINWAGVAIFRKAHAIFRKRAFQSTLLAAAFRYRMHWDELIGDRVVQTIPYKWWQQFNSSDVVPARSIDRKIAAEVQRVLYKEFEDFRKAYDEDGLTPGDFASFGPSVHTLRQFLEGYHNLLELVRARMLR